MSDTLWRVVDRFKEPSSWAALAAPLAALGVSVPSDYLRTASLLGAGICVLLGIIMKEKSA